MTQCRDCMKDIKNLKKQAFWAVFGAAIIAFLGTIITLYVIQQHRFVDINQLYFENVHSSYTKNIEQNLKIHYTTQIEKLLSKEVIEAVKNKQRTTLGSLINKKFEMLKLEDKYIKQLHFHLPNGFTLYRAHQPNHFDDDIASVRPMAKTVHQKQEIVFGFEGGKNGLSYRVFVPIFEKNEYLGALEIGVSPQKLLDMVTYFNNIDALIHLEKSQLQNDGKSITFSKLKDEKMVDNFSLNFEKECALDYKNDKFIVNKIEMVDFSGEKIGEFVFFNNLTKEYNYLYQELLVLVILFFIAFIALQMIVSSIFSKLIGNINDVKSELETILHTSRDGIAILDMNTQFLFFNDSYLAMTGFSKEELLSKSCAELSAPEDLQRAIKILEIVKNVGFVDNFEKTCIVKDGKRVVVNMAISLMPDGKRVLISTKDITEAKQIQRQIDDYVKLIDENIITSSTDTDGNITSVSKAFCEISEFSKEELLGQNHRLIRHPDMPVELFEEMWQKIINDEIWEGEVKNKTKSCGFYWVHNKIYPLYDETKQKVGYTAIRQDITDKKRIEELSITDGLTNIYNRRYFNEMFPKLIASAKRKGELVCFILMDIDCFKFYNDTYGHQMGDDVLIEVAKAMKESLHRADDYCFRLGGEEFGVYFKAKSKEDAVIFANLIRTNIENLHIEHKKNPASPFVTSSAGLVVLDACDIRESDELYKDADDLLYKAKENGRNRVMVNEKW